MAYSYDRRSASTSEIDVSKLEGAAEAMSKSAFALEAVFRLLRAAGIPESALGSLEKAVHLETTEWAKLTKKYPFPHD